MPKGKRISSESRLTMYNLHCEGWSPEDIFYVLFSNDTTRISLDHIVNRCRFFASSEGEVIAKYIIGTEEHGGRPWKMDADILLKQITDSTRRSWPRYSRCTLPSRVSTLATLTSPHLPCAGAHQVHRQDFDTVQLQRQPP